MTVEVRGVDLAIEDTGSGTPVLWGHGLTSSMAAEAAMGMGVADLPEDRYRLVRYDARGHGDSGGTADPGRLRLSVVGRRPAGAGRCPRASTASWPAGMSLGSGTALHVAVAAPDRVLALVLGIPPTAWEGRRARGAAYRDRGRVVAEQGMDGVHRAGHGRALGRDLRPLRRPGHGRHPRTVTRATTRTCWPRCSPVSAAPTSLTRDASPRSRCPCSCWPGRATRPPPRRPRARLAELLPQAEVVDRPDAEARSSAGAAGCATSSTGWFSRSSRARCRPAT